MGGAVPLIVFAAAFGLSLLLVAVVRAWSLSAGRVAHPRPDRWHRQPTALMGGVGIFTAFILVCVGIGFTSGWDTIPWGVLAGSALIFGLGVADDLKPVSPQGKLVVQLLAAALVVSLGYSTNFFTPRIPNSVVAQLPNILLTFFWLVGITNAINLLDNMDGLAGGIALITALFLSFFFWDAGNQGLLLVALALGGSILGFLAFNFPPATIFMGDSGSLFLGFTLAVMAIAHQPQASNVLAVLGVPSLLFLLPILDTTLVTFTRLLRGQSPAQGGRDHTSHRLIAFGLSERQAVLVLYLVAILAGMLAAGIEALNYWLSLVLVPVVLIILALLTAYLGGVKVISPEPGRGLRGTALTRLMLNLTYRRRILEVGLDFFVIGVALYLAFLTQFGLVMTDQVLELYLQALPLALGAVYLSSFTFGVYRGVWRYMGFADLLRFLRTALFGSALSWIMTLLLFPDDYFPISIFIVFGVTLFLGISASRSSFRLLDGLFSTQIRPIEQRVLIGGAGDAGELAVRWMQMNAQITYRPVGFIDPDPFMHGREIHGIAVLGGIEQLEALIQSRSIDGLILTADANGSQAFREQALSICRRSGCWVRVLRLEFEILE
jgi:UDP-GlcNAc:undecaprenyl-phosphate/decaprenyl-phosphate GlcNAc-1-phosphate transferase